MDYQTTYNEAMANNQAETAIKQLTLQTQDNKKRGDDKKVVFPL